MNNDKVVFGYRTFFVAFLLPPILYSVATISATKYYSDSASSLILFLIIWVLLLVPLIKIVTIREKEITIKRLLFIRSKKAILPFEEIEKIQLSAMPRSTFALMKIHKRDSTIAEFRLGLMNFELRKLAQKLNSETAFITEENILL